MELLIDDENKSHKIIYKQEGGQREQYLIKWFPVKYEGIRCMNLIPIGVSN
jgi:hypothetical protein